MTEDELRKGADSQSDQPLSNGHPTDEDGKPIYPPPPDETAGKVTNADYLDGQGVGFAASVHDPDIARGLYAGNFDVSVHPKFEFGERDPETGAVIAENIRFQDLATVSKGDSPSNTAQWGPSSELLAFVHTEMADELPVTESDDDHDDGGFDDDVDESTVSLWRQLGTRLGLTAEQTPDEGAESPRDADDGHNSMTDREKQIQTLVSDHGFDEETLEPMADEQLTAMHSKFTEDLDPEPDDPEPDDPNDTNVVELDIGEYDNVNEYIAEQAQEAVATATEATEREELIAQITAAKDMTADDLDDTPTAVLEELAASSSTSAELPGATGRNTGTVMASVGNDGDDDLDAYGTGVH